MTDKELLNTYITIAEFMSLCFAEDVEVLVHDVEHLEHSTIAIFNNHVSGRNTGAPMTRRGCEFIEEALHSGNNWVVNYSGMTDKGVTVRASTLFIKNPAGKLIGTLCVNVDVRKYQVLRQLADSMTAMAPSPGTNNEPEVLTTGSGRTLDKTIENCCTRIGRTVDLLSMDDRLDIIWELYRQHYFDRKGAIVDVAARLKISEPSVYRYLKTIKRGANNEHRY